MKNKEKGSITIEAISTLAIFVLFCVIMMGFADMIRAQIMIQSAITETAKEISTYSYILAKVGYFDIRQEISDSSEEHDALKKIKESYTGLVTTINDGKTVEASDFEELIDTLENLSVKDATAPALNIGAEKASDYFVSVASKKLVKKYLEDANGSTDYLKNLGVDGGYEGLDFSASHFPQGTDDTLRITVIYHVKIIDVPFFEDISFDRKVALNATTRVWGN